MTRTFGTPTSSKTFEWAHIGDDGEPVTETFTAKPFLTFAQVIEFNAQKQMLNMSGALARDKQVEQLKSMRDDDDAETTMVRMRELADELVAREIDRFGEVADLVLALVVESDHERLRPLLIDSDMTAVQELLAWLEKVVVTRTEDEVEVVAGVDPTSPAPPAG